MELIFFNKKKRCKNQSQTNCLKLKWIQNGRFEQEVVWSMQHHFMTHCFGFTMPVLEKCVLFLIFTGVRVLIQKEVVFFVQLLKCYRTCLISKTFYFIDCSWNTFLGPCQTKLKQQHTFSFSFRKQTKGVQISSLPKHNCFCLHFFFQSKFFRLEQEKVVDINILTENNKPKKTVWMLVWNISISF